MKLFTLSAIVSLSVAENHHSHDDHSHVDDHVHDAGDATSVACYSSNDPTCRVCRKDTSVCVYRNETHGCRYNHCPGKPAWAKHGGNKTKVSDRFENNQKYKDVFLDGDDFKGLTKDERKYEKQRFIKEHRGDIIKFKKEDEEALSYDNGGIKMSKRWDLIKKQNNLTDDMELPFKMIDDPEYVGDTLEVVSTDMIFFEDEARFKYGHHNYTLKTVRKTSTEGYHKTTFTHVEDGTYCEIDGATDSSCRIDGPENVKFEMLFSGSGGGSVTTSHCLSQDTPNVITAPDAKYTFNAVPWVVGEYIGLSVGTYVFNNEANPLHPILIDPVVIDGESVFSHECTEWKNGSFSDASVPGSLNPPTSDGFEGCIGNYTVTIHREFNVIKYWCNTHGWMGGNGNGNEGRILYDDTCAKSPVVTPPDDDSNVGAIVGGVVGGVAVFGLGVFGAAKGGWISIGALYDPIINGHLVNSV